MSYDVGIGKCRAISESMVEVWVDGSVVRRLQPSSLWQRAGVSVLRVPIEACSQSRTLKLQEEVFLGSGRIEPGLQGSLDVDGNGQYESVRLQQLIPQVDEAQAKQPPVIRRNTWR